MRLTLGCSWLLFALGLIVSPLSAQTPVPVQSGAVDRALLPELQLRLVGANNPQTAGSSREAKEFVVQITDATGAAVPDAAIVFRLPDSDPTGTFSDGTHASVTYTDPTGRANSSGIQWSSTPGIVPIRISATKGTAHAGILVEQTLTAVLPATPAAIAPGVLASGAPSPLFVLPVQQLPTLPAKLRDQQPIANPSPQAPSAPPAVTVTGGSPEIGTHSAKKWIIIAAIAAGAGLGVAMATKSKSKSSSSSTSSSPSIGAPSLSIGQ